MTQFAVPADQADTPTDTEPTSVALRASIAEMQGALAELKAELARGDATTEGLTDTMSAHGEPRRLGDEPQDALAERGTPGRVPLVEAQELAILAVPLLFVVAACWTGRDWIALGALAVFAVAFLTAVGVLWRRSVLHDRAVAARQTGPGDAA